MDTASQYQVVFSGHLRKGFEQDQVRDTLAKQLRLSEKQAALLFSGERKHTLKRTTTEEEAKRFVLQLARLGVVASVEQTADNTEDEPPKAPQKAEQKEKKKKKAAPAKKQKSLPKYSPLPRNGMFRPILYISAAIEALFTTLYALLLVGLVFGTFYYNLFTLWASHVVGHPLLALALQLICFPLGTVALLLLAKPLLSLRQLRHRGVRIPAGQEPDLHMFVEDVCQQIEQPMPVEIRLNNDVAVNVYHHRGWIGFWRGQTVLSLGVPLVAAMNTSQLAALIAQAMICFRGRHSPRVSFLVMAGNRWLHQAVYGEDMLDRGLCQWRDKGRLSPGMVSALQTVFQASRNLMKLRLMISRGLERRLVHRLVAEADKRAYALAGTEGFSHLLEQQRLLDHAIHEEVDGLRQQWSEKGELPDDMVQHLLAHARAYPVDIHNRLRIRQERKKADTGDIIPSDAQRIKSLSRQHRIPGYDCLSPANTLLRHFSKLARTMTLRYYHNRLQIPITPDKLVRQVIKGSVEDELNTTIDRYFHNLTYLQLPLKLGLLLQGKTEAGESQEQWQKSLSQCKTEYSRAKLEHTALVEAEEKLLENSMHETLYRAELWRQLGEEKPRKDELESFYQQCRNSENEYEEALQKMRQYLKPYANRLAAAVALLQHNPELTNGGKLLKEVKLLIATYDRIENVLPQLRALKLHTYLLQTLLSYQSAQKQPRLNDRIEEQAADIRQHETSIRVALKDVPNPYPAPRGGKSLMAYLLLESYTEETPAGDFDRGNDIVLRLTFLQKRILGRLIALANEVEKTLR